MDASAYPLWLPHFSLEKKRIKGRSEERKGGREKDTQRGRASKEKKG
jgi:hypothetical protein